MIMKHGKRILAVFCAAALSLSFTACAGKKSATLKVGASPAPHAEILEAAKPLLAEQGIELEIVEFDDYVLPNTALSDGDLDANYFQHQPYLDTFNAGNGTDLISAASIHYEPLGIYPGRAASLEALADGGKVAVPNDGSNEARALYLLEANGLIKVNHDVGYEATVLDVTENPKNIEIIELDADKIPGALPDVDLAVINGNYAIDAGLKVSDALAVEAADGEAGTAYANVLTVKEGRENEPAIQALVEALQSQQVKDFIDETYDGAVVAVF